MSLHIPVNAGAKGRNKSAEDPIGGAVSNRKDFYRILKPYNAHIISGHTHFNEKVIEGNIIEHVQGCGLWHVVDGTDHMFLAKPSASSKTITVQVTDRFNTIYKKQTETIDLRKQLEAQLR